MAMVSTRMPSESHTAPTAQGSHVLSTSTSKKSHETTQDVEPGEEDLPASHLMHSSSVPAAIAVEDLPAVQSVQEDAPSLEKPPALQSRQKAVPLLLADLPA